MSNIFSIRSFILLVCLLFGLGQVNAQIPRSLPFTGGLAALPVLSSYQNEWEEASRSGNIAAKRRIAEKIGEEGAKRYAAEQGWKPLLSHADKGIPQGLDQVYRGSGGTIYVLEAKGGNSPLGNAYGHRQGTIEWTLESATRTLNSNRATEKEKQAARVVLDAARRGKLGVGVVRTPHDRGIPGSLILESMIRADKKTVSGLRVPTTVQITGKAASTTSRLLGRSVPAIGIGLIAYDTYSTEYRYRVGELDSDIRTGKHVTNASVLGGSAVVTGYALLAAPEPIITTIAGSVIIVGGATVHFVLEQTQAQRIADRQRLFRQVGEKERNDGIFEELRGMANR